MGCIKFYLANESYKKSAKLINEALNENMSDASFRNLLALLPFKGTKVDDPCEPTIIELLQDYFLNSPFKQQIDSFIQGAYNDLYITPLNRNFNW